MLPGDEPRDGRRWRRHGGPAMSEGSGWVVALVVVLALAAVVGIVVGVRRHRYVSALRARGWVFDSRPSPQIARGLVVPPFGLGFRRGTDEHVSGRTRAGTAFQVFEYEAAGDARVVCMPLGIALPELVATSPGQVRMGVVLPVRRMLPGGGMLLSADETYADDVLAVAGAAMAAFAARHPLSLAIDGDQLTQVGAPKDPDELEAYLEALEPVAAAIRGAHQRLERYRQPEPPQRLGFYHRPSWYYLPEDDGVLAAVAHTTGGSNHRTRHVVHGEFFPGAWFVALEHHWQTQRTETYTDANGNTQTRTVTDNHMEVIHEITLPFSVPDLEIVDDSRLRRLVKGRSLDFELSAFNQAYDVYCSVPKFAYDVLHPRQIEYLMAARVMPFSMSGRTVRPRPLAHDAESIAFELDLLAGFFARFPEFVWQDLGVSSPPLRLTPEGRIAVLDR